MQMESNSTVSKEDEQMELPPGFRFHPTDEELITHYLAEKVLDNNLTTIAIGEADLNKIEPWDLPRQAKMGEKEWYFFVVRDRKYPTGLRTNRATEAGYWKATGKDKEIYKAKVLVGMKKTLVFYTGRAPKGAKTNWVMHEYRLEGKYSKLPKNTKNDWVISRIFNKSSSAKKSDVSEMVYAQDLHSSFLPPLMDSSPSNKCDPKSVTLQDLHPSFLPPLMDSSPNKSEPSSAITSNPSHVTCFSNLRMLDHQFPATKQEEIGMFGTSTSTNLTTPSSSLFPYSKSSLSSLLSEHDMPDFDFADSFLTQDQSMLKLLLEGKGTTPNSSEIPAIDGLSGFPNQYITNNLTTPIEHNSFWDY